MCSSLVEIGSVEIRHRKKERKKRKKKPQR